jgi:hypothetical protein
VQEQARHGIKEVVSQEGKGMLERFKNFLQGGV